MNLIYTNDFTKMKPGSSRYALMLGEDGMVKDDGIICKISDQHFIATTTTGGAANVLSCMEEYAQTEWPELNVYMNSITGGIGFIPTGSFIFLGRVGTRSSFKCRTIFWRPPSFVGW